MSWKNSLKHAYRSPKELLDDLGLDIPYAQTRFPFLVTREFAQRIEPGNPDDPLLKQVLPSPLELVSHPQDQIDPLGEEASTPIPGLLHKYPHRALVILSGGCAINCRYCFRRDFPYSEHTLSEQASTDINTYLRNNPSIHELILSGGDPLLIPDQRLEQLIQRLLDQTHITTLRIHTRLPVVIPERVTPDLLRILKPNGLNSVLVTHMNHPHEIDDAVKHCMHALSSEGIMLLNQSVLLKGINDTPQTLMALSQKLLSCHIMPYYLHMLDPVTGVNHFSVSLSHAQQLIKELREQMPGYLVPRLVQEIAGACSKTPVETST